MAIRLDWQRKSLSCSSSHKCSPKPRLSRHWLRRRRPFEIPTEPKCMFDEYPIRGCWVVPRQRRSHTQVTVLTAATQRMATKTATGASTSQIQPITRAPARAGHSCGVSSFCQNRSHARLCTLEVRGTSSAWPGTIFMPSRTQLLPPDIML